MKIAENGTAYTLSGPEDAPVLILVHGLGLRRETWDGVLEFLPRQYRILNYDLYGHGQSIAPPETASLSVFSKQLRSLMDELAIEKAAIAGFSLGGMINRRFAMDHPQRVSSLVIFNSPHDRGEEAQQLVEARARDTSKGGPGANLQATIERWFTPQFIVDNPDFIEKIKTWVLANDADSYAQCRFVLAHGVRELTHPQVQLAVPSLVVTCENDSGSTPAMSHAIAAQIKGADVHIVPKLQHMGLTEKPQIFAQIMHEFLQDQ